MMRWQYRSMVATDKDGWKVKYKGRSSALSEVLTELGDDGWELVAVIPAHEESGGALRPRSEGATYGPGHNTFDFLGGNLIDQIELFLKRPVEPDA